MRLSHHPNPWLFSLRGRKAQRLSNVWFCSDAARTFKINHFPFEIESPCRQPGMRMDDVDLGAPAFVDSFAAAANCVTTDDIKRALARAIGVQNMVLVAVVSNGEDLHYNNYLP